MVYSRVKRAAFIFLLGVLTPFQVASQTSDEQVVQDGKGLITLFDTTDVSLRIPDSTAVRVYANNPDFIYGSLPPAQQSLISRIVSYLMNKLSQWFAHPLFGPFMRLTFILILVALALALLNQLLGGNMGSMITGRANSRIKPRFTESEIREEDLDKRIRSALANNEYDIATRYLFLKLLRVLSDKNLIQWSLEKTNYEYVTELRPTGLGGLFRELAMYYEYAEYGDFEINKADFEHIQRLFDQLEKKSI